ncbi:ATP-dependent helicase [Allokutzneria sp. NRRL B-24872]|uniref:ATP-dependent helicase n=1 Tax=Allokutzneria sp. NRRL B-24872 TaxID=1137961 RepID=UPI000A396262|nr:UvrD-helicase domain-containing protein [Allokutzneria sp. NRRL B-24872]
MTASPARIAEALGLHPPTPEQAEVIAATTEPALVIAGAGAGKTETMAARVVWLVANGLVTPDRVLGLTFTRKAARQLADRVRLRLRRLAGSGLLEDLDPSGERRNAVLTGEPTVLTYHAYAGRLVGEHGLRLPVEPGARLLRETASWQLAHRVVSSWTEDINTDKVPSTVTGYLLALAGELGEHLVSPERLRTHAEAFCRAVESAPKGPRQRNELSQDMQKVLAAQRLRIALLPLVEEYAARKRREATMDFADQMAMAARLAEEHPEVVTGERERYGAVLLDEYQDTGHAQRVLLRALFGGGHRTPVPVTAVGDPAQAIYGWRGASAANLPRFATDFPRYGEDRLEPARRYGLLTSFRNPPQVLALANAVSEPLRTAGLDVEPLRAKDNAGPGDVRVALLPDVQQELDWMADTISAYWESRVDATGESPTAAVLVRRRSDMAEIATALRDRGLPVEVVGLGGLLDEPEVRDLVSALRVLVDPLAGTAAMRLLTGSRWRMGVSDIAALWDRAKFLAGGADAKPTGTDAIADALPGEHAELAGLVDAVDDPGDAEAYSEEGFKRVRKLGRELAALRRRMDQPLPELVADVERNLLLDIETLARPNKIGRAQLDAFADVVADFASASPSATLPSLLDFLSAAERAEDGLEPGEVEVAEDRVQILTVHSAKGLEWEIVAVPHLGRDVFPGKKKSSSWLRTPQQLPAELRGDSQDLPTLSLESCANRKEIETALKIHEEDFEERRLIEERRLLYVALTRAEHALLVSGHWWGETGEKPRGPSDFLTEIHAAMVESPEIGSVQHWAPEPVLDEGNPLAQATKSAKWPHDPLSRRRAAVQRGADMVRAALQEPPPEVDEEDDPEGWARDVDVLLEERASAATRREQVVLPSQLSVSQLVELAADPAALARRLRRPLPFPPNPTARRGTAFHAWLERRFGATRLLDLDELPGAADETAVPDADLEDLQRSFLASEWADRTPEEVEVPFETEVDGIAVRGRMDAVFADKDGGWTVVDWKTGAVPDSEHLPAVTVQLAAYRLAWASLREVPLERVRAAFHYVRHDHTLRPTDLLDAEGLRGLLRSVPRPG